MAEKYKIGAVSQIIAKSAGKPQKVDPKLAALFGSSAKKSSSVAPTLTSLQPPTKTLVKVENQSKPKKKALKKLKKPKLMPDPQPQKIKPSVKLDTKLKNKDAAEIRVKAKRSVRNDAVAAQVLENTPKQVVGTGGNNQPKKAKAMKKRNKKTRPKQSQSTVQDDTISSSSTPTEHNQVNDPDPVSIKKRRMIAKSNEYMRKAKMGNVKKEKKEIDEDSSGGDEDDDGGKHEEDTIVKEEPDDEAPTETKPEKKSVTQMNAPKPKNAELEARTIYVGNLSGTLRKKELMKIFKKFGKIDTIRLRCAAPNKPYLLKKVAVNSKELHPNNDSLAAYVRFVTKEDAEKACQESKGLVIQDRHVSVDLADKSTKKDNKRAIFVGNLSLKLTDEELWRFFEECGKIESVRIIRDQATGMGKGFGYVNFDDRSAVETAIKTKNQQNLQNRSIRVSRCVKKLKVKKTKDGRNSVKKVVDKPGTQSKNGPKQRHQPNERSQAKGKFSNRPNHSSKPNPKHENVLEYTGDRLAEIGRLKRKSKKPNRGEIRKAKLVALLNKSSLQLTSDAKRTNQKKYFN